MYSQATKFWVITYLPVATALPSGVLQNCKMPASSGEGMGPVSITCRHLGALKGKRISETDIVLGLDDLK